MAFLKDIPPSEVHVLSNIDGRVGVYQVLEQAPVRVGGIDSPKGIWMHPIWNQRSYAAYRLDRKYSMLDGGAGINDSAPNGAESAIIFEILGDGKRLWRSRPLQKGGSKQFFSIDVRRIRNLVLVVRSTGGIQKAHAVWIEPRLQQKVRK